MSEVHSAVGSYVVNALDGPELDEFEAHLATCETCSREIREFSEAAAELSLLVATPPPSLRSSILAAIKEVRPLPPEVPQAEAPVPQAESEVPPTEAPVPQAEAEIPPTEAPVPPTEAEAPQAEAEVPPTEAEAPQAEAEIPPTEAPEAPPAPGAQPRLRPGGTPRRALIEPDQMLPEEEEDEGEPPPVDTRTVRTQLPTVRPVDELALRRARRRNRVLAVLVAAAMVAAVALGGWVYTLVQNRQEQVAEAALETQLYSASDVKIYPLRLPSGARFSFVVSKSLNRALFVSDNLPAAGTGKVYELWTVAEAPIRDATFQGGGARKQWFTGTLAGKAAVAITIENEGGAQTPTPPVTAANI